MVKFGRIDNGSLFYERLGENSYLVLEKIGYTSARIVGGENIIPSFIGALKEYEVDDECETRNIYRDAETAD